MFYFAKWIRKNNRSQYPRENDPRKFEATVYIRCFWVLVVIVELTLLAILAFAHPEGSASNIFVAMLQICTFLLKVTLMLFVYVWVRWTIPRFRYDQLQKLGWQKLLPLALLNIFVTGALVVAFG